MLSLQKILRIFIKRLHRLQLPNNTIMGYYRFHKPLSTSVNFLYEILNISTYILLKYLNKKQINLMRVCSKII